MKNRNFHTSVLIAWFGDLSLTLKMTRFPRISGAVRAVFIEDANSIDSLVLHTCRTEKFYLRKYQ